MINIHYTYYVLKCAHTTTHTPNTIGDTLSIYFTEELVQKTMLFPITCKNIQLTKSITCSHRANDTDVNESIEM